MEKRRGKVSSPSIPIRRRREMRFAPPPQLTCTVLGTPAKVEVRDISVGGLALWTPQPLKPGVTYKLSLQIGKLTVMLSARPTHIKPQDDCRWVVGMAFVDGPTTSPGIEELLDVIAGMTLDFS